MSLSLKLDRICFQCFKDTSTWNYYSSYPAWLRIITTTTQCSLKQKPLETFAVLVPKLCVCVCVHSMLHFCFPKQTNANNKKNFKKQKTWIISDFSNTQVYWLVWGIGRLWCTNLPSLKYFSLCFGSYHLKS